MPTVSGLFNGIGGGLLGARWAGFDVEYAWEERDFFSPTTFATNFSGTPFNIEGSVFPESDLLISSPSCDMFSNLGTKRKDKGKIDEYYWQDLQILRALYRIKYIKPKAFIVENVTNVLKHVSFNRHGALFSDIKIPFDMENYDVQTLKLDAFNYGVPQHRKRVYFVGIHKDFGGFIHDYNESFLTNSHVHQLLVDHFVGRTIKKGFENLPMFNNEKPNHSEKRIEGFKNLKIGDSYYGTQNNKRLDPNKPAGTIASHC